jgi:pantothenate kinase-related protein Tda10
LTYYLPVALWLEQQVKLGKKDKSKGAVCVGLSVPQGGGKTTISDCLETVMNVLDIKTGVVSYDDFYLNYQEQSKLAEENPGNQFL